MKLSKVSVLCAAFLLVGAPPSWSQGQSYHYSYGGGRIVNQGQIGLSNPSGTYIGPGTLSQTARGNTPGGAQANPGLPAVNFGAHIGTPGDNQYSQAPLAADPHYATRSSNRAPVRSANNNRMGLPSSSLGANIGTPGDTMRSDLHPYTPLSNRQGQSSTRPAFQPGNQYEYHPNSNVPDTYGDGQSGQMSY